MGFQHVPIEVVAKVSDKPIPQLEAGVSIPPTEEVNYQEIPDFAPSDDPFDFRQPEQDPEVTFEECRDVTMMVVNLPNMFGLSTISRDEGDCTQFAKELQKYCARKGLDPRGWFFDEFGVLTTGLGLLGGMWREHKEYKKENPKGAKKGIDVGTGVGDSYHFPPSDPDKEVPEARPDNAAETDGVGMVRR